MSPPFEEWFKRRRTDSWFADFNGAILFPFPLMQEALRNAEQQVPKNLMKERKLEDGSTVHEVGPIVYGYSVKTGQDGKPIVRKFGNVDSSFSISLTLIMLVHSSTLFCISSASSIPFCIPEIFYSDDSFIAGWEGSTFGGLAIFDTGFLSVLSCVPHEKFIIR
jgi:hypothetical protein